MSKNDTGFIKILYLVLILGCTRLFSGCAEHKAQLYSDLSDTHSQQEILNGEEVSDTHPLAKKVLFLATGAKLLKTVGGGHTATQTGQCTATAISSNIILTAAHCLKATPPAGDQTPDSVFIILGRKPWKSKFNPKLWYAADQIFIHPGYKKFLNGGSVDDIALIKLKNALPTEHITELATADELSSTMLMTLAGYGLRSNLKNLSEADVQNNLGELFQLTKVISDFDIHKLTIEIDQHDQKGICSGDSGGPGLIYSQLTNKYMTIGVVSGNLWMINDKLANDPQDKLDCFGTAIYTNVMNPGYLDWIQKTIQSIK